MKLKARHHRSPHVRPRAFRRRPTRLTGGMVVLGMMGTVLALAPASPAPATALSAGHAQTRAQAAAISATLTGHLEPEARAEPAQPDPDHPTTKPVIGQYWQIQKRDYLSKAGALYPGDPLQNACAIAWLNGYREHPNLVFKKMKFYLPLRSEMAGILEAQRFELGRAMDDPLKVFTIERKASPVEVAHNKAAKEDFEHREQAESLNHWWQVEDLFKEASQRAGLPPQQSAIVLDALEKHDVAALSRQPSALPRIKDGLLQLLDDVPNRKVPEGFNPQGYRDGLDYMVANALSRVLLDGSRAEILELAEQHPDWKLDPGVMDRAPNPWLDASAPGTRGSNTGQLLLAAARTSVTNPAAVATTMEADMRSPAAGFTEPRETRVGVLKALVRLLDDDRFEPTFAENRLPPDRPLPPGALRPIQRAQVRGNDGSGILLGQLGVS